MKKIHKWVALCTAALMLVTAATGCQGKAKVNVVKAGELVMGTNPEFPPFEYKEGGAIVGFDADLMTEIAKRMNLKLTIKEYAFDSLPDAMMSKEIDVIAAGYTIKPDREKVMDFTDTYYAAQQTIIVKGDSTVATKADIEGKKIGGQAGTTGCMIAEDLTDKKVIKGYANGALAIEDLLNGNLDAVIIDNNPAKEYKKRHGDKIKLVENQFDAEQYAVGVTKGNKTLLDEINKQMKAIKDDGTFQKIVDKYIK